MWVMQEDASPAFSLNENPAFDLDGQYSSPVERAAADGDALSSTPAPAQGGAQLEACVRETLDVSLMSHLLSLYLQEPWES